MLLSNDTVWMETLRHTATMLNAYYGEYNFWSFFVFVALGVYLYKKVRNKKLSIYGINRLYIIGVVNFLLYLTFPTDYHSWIMVSSFRYSLPTFIPLVLCVFLLFAHFKKDVWLGFLAIGSSLMVLTMSYYPKLTILYLLVALILMYGIEKCEKKYIATKSKNESITKLFD